MCYLCLCFVDYKELRPTRIRDNKMKKTMKIMAMVLFVFGMTALTSCSKSKDKLILGKWELQSLSVSSEGFNMEMTVEDFYAMMGVNEDEIEDVIFEFRSDGYVYMDGEGAPYSIEGDKLIIEDVDESEQMVEYETMIISELTDKALTLEQTEYNEDLGGNMTVAMHFKRV